jgi:hypothetical protein
MKNRNFTKKYKTINSNNYAKLEVKWQRGSQFTVRHTKNCLKITYGEERRILFIFDDFHFCRSRVIEPDITENRIFTLCRMITLVVFIRPSSRRDVLWYTNVRLSVRLSISQSLLNSSIIAIILLNLFSSWIYTTHSPLTVKQQSINQILSS